MKLNWKKFFGGGGAQNKKPSVGGGGSMDIFWNCTIRRIWSALRRMCMLIHGLKGLSFSNSFLVNNLMKIYTPGWR